MRKDSNFGTRPWNWIFHLGIKIDLDFEVRAQTKINTLDLLLEVVNRFFWPQIENDTFRTNFLPKLC